MRGVRWLDRSSGLEWLFPREKERVLFTWNEAASYVITIGVNWRIPTVTEMLSIIDYSNHRPAVKNEVRGLNVPIGYCWTSTRYQTPDSAGYMYIVSTVNGCVDVFMKPSRFLVLPVRGMCKEGK